MCLLSSASESIKWTKETRQSALTFFMLSLDGLVQLPIIQTPLLDTNLTHSSPPAAPKVSPSLILFICFFFVFFVFLNLVFPSSVRTPQRSSSGSKLRQTSSHVSHAGHQSTHLTPQRFNPLAPTISVWSRVTKQSRSNKKTHTHTHKMNSPLKAAHSSHQQHHCLSLFTPTDAFNPPSSSSSLLLSLSSLSNMLHKHSNDFIDSMRSFRGRINTAQQRGINPFHLRLEGKMGKGKKRMWYSTEMEKNRARKNVEQLMSTYTIN